MRKTIAAVAMAAVSLAATPALAAWQEASSDHFLIYGDTSPSNIRKFSEQLERYHAAMSFITSGEDLVPSPSNRVTVFLVGSEAQVRKIAGPMAQKYMAGFYLPRAGRSLAVIPTVQGSTNGEPDFSMIVLLHEYAHHFIISASNQTYPRWMNEGAAEFFASAKFENDGSVWVGRPARHRAGELFYATDVTARDLLDPDSYEKRRGKSQSYDAYYGKAWLLYHYLFFNKARQGQKAAYLKAIASGVALRDAAVQAFGDFKVLEGELDKYLQASKVSAYKIPPKYITIRPITVRALGAGEAAIMPVRIRSSVGVDDKTAPVVLADARTVAAKFPKDSVVQTALAEAEFDAGHDAEAIAAADAAIAADPKQTNAYVQKGYALFREAEKGDDRNAFRAARAPFLKLNEIENDHPLPLFYFYLSYLRSGTKPNANAIQGLQRAAELAPFDLGVRMTAAMQAIRDGKKDLARSYLTPIAYNPHGGGLAEMARRRLERLDKDANWKGDDEAIADDPEKKGTD